jgi:hypothetical protein
LYSREDVSNSRGWRETHTADQHADEDANCVVDVRNWDVSLCNEISEAHVVKARVSLENQGPGELEKVGKRHTSLGTECL